MLAEIREPPTKTAVIRVLRELGWPGEFPAKRAAIVDFLLLRGILIIIIKIIWALRIDLSKKDKTRDKMSESFILQWLESIEGKQPGMLKPSYWRPVSENRMVRIFKYVNEVFNILEKCV